MIKDIEEESKTKFSIKVEFSFSFKVYTFFINIGLPLQQPYVIFDSPKFRRQTVITPYHIHAAEFHKQVYVSQFTRQNSSA